MACEQSRQIWQEADEALTQSVNDRTTAADDVAAKTADKEAADQAALDAAEALAAAETALADANAQVQSDADRANNAWQNYTDCLTGTGRIDPTKRR